MGAAQSTPAAAAGDLLDAAQRGDEVRLAALLGTDAAPAAQADVAGLLNAADDNGRTPLTLLVRSELSAEAKATWVRRIAALGATVDRPDRREWTALHYAADRGADRRRLARASASWTPG